LDFGKNKSISKLFEKFESEFRNFQSLTKGDNANLLDVKAI
jgi:hypothetical protein